MLDDSSPRWLASRPQFLDNAPQCQLESLIISRRSLDDDERGGLLPWPWCSPDDSSRRRLTPRPQFLDNAPRRQLESLVVIRRSRVCCLGDGALPTIHLFLCTFYLQVTSYLLMCVTTQKCVAKMPQFCPRFTPDSTRDSLISYRKNSQRNPYLNLGHFCHIMAKKNDSLSVL